MPTYTVHNGPCHYDVQLCYYLFISGRYIRANHHNPNSRQARRWLTRTSRRQKQRLEKQFHSFFNPDLKRQGIWKLYEFGKCCSFHIDISIHLPPRGWFGLNETQIRAQLPAGCGMIVVDSLGVTEHPHASIGGLRLLIDRRGGKFTFAHEIGHNLGLEDDYRTPAIPELGVQGNGMTREEERRHRGHLMGKKARGRIKRAVQPHELEAIAVATGMTCDVETCCPRERKRDFAQDKKALQKPASKIIQNVDEIVLIPGHPTAIGAHSGAIAPFDLAAELIGKTRLSKILENREKRNSKKERN